MFPQIKDIKHIKQDFHFIAWVISRGGGGRWCAESAKEFKKIEHGHVASQTDRDDEHNIILNFIKFIFFIVGAVIPDSVTIL